ncbi:hypothetical protein [Aliivibrio sifiae]|uniref:hypothetical protein n=1 Tax=Aliivibrio sifiae TaxID=566293 RepID=UPI003D129CDD
MTKNYWVQAAKYRISKANESTTSSIDDSICSANITVHNTYNNNALCGADDVLIEYLNEFKRLRCELKSLSSSDDSSKEHLKVIN